MRRSVTLLAILAIAISLTQIAETASPGRKATILTTSEETIEGQFSGASDAGLTVLVAGQPIVIPWDSVAQLSFVGNPRAAAPAGSDITTTAPASTSSSASRATSSTTRCQATTQKGTQCKRNAKPGSRYCWQHGG